MAGLTEIRREIEAGEFEFDPALEDIHMAIESRLTARLGEVGKKLHTARSRNDQVALDVRLYLAEEVEGLINDLAGLRLAGVRLAHRHQGVIMPGYTHLQRAQPILFAHHLLAYDEMWRRDIERLHESLQRIKVSPLGAAALAGTTFPIDPAAVAAELGFPRVFRNSLDAVSDRDFLLEFAAHASIIMVHLSRLAEELILWSASEFGFVALPDAYATGSSIMPQKKNPDVPELIRGKTGRVAGHLMGLLMIMKGLPLAYNRDLQEDKEHLFDTVDTVRASVTVDGGPGGKSDGAPGGHGGGPPRRLSHRHRPGRLPGDQRHAVSHRPRTGGEHGALRRSPGPGTVGTEPDGDPAVRPPGRARRVRLAQH